MVSIFQEDTSFRIAVRFTWSTNQGDKNYPFLLPRSLTKILPPSEDFRALHSTTELTATEATTVSTNPIERNEIILLEDDTNDVVMKENDESLAYREIDQNDLVSNLPYKPTSPSSTSANLTTRPPKPKPSAKKLSPKKKKEKEKEKEKKNEEDEEDEGISEKREGVVLGAHIDTEAKFYRLRNLCKWHLNNRRGYTIRAGEFGITQECDTDKAHAMCLLHRCIYLSHPETVIKNIDQVPDFKGERKHRKDFILENFRMMPPGSFDGWKCYLSGCADGTYVTKLVTAEERRRYKQGTWWPPYEKNIETLNTKREEMLRRAGIIPLEPPVTTCPSV